MKNIKQALKDKDEAIKNECSTLLSNVVRKRRKKEKTERLRNSTGSTNKRIKRRAIKEEKCHD